MVAKRKLIEVSIPLDEINAQSAREKSIRHGHPSTLHLWWARRPLATARAVLFAQLVDDPSVREDEYLAEAHSQGFEDPQGWADHRVKQERERLFGLITKMVNWDNIGDEALFDEIRDEIAKSTGGNPPAILDPFAGGGTIPLEAQRLGLEAHASDLNPVAVLINKALIEIPPKFAGNEPVFPGTSVTQNSWPKASGLAEDVRRYGEWMRDEAEQRIGHLYPKATLADGTQATVIAWIWARTVTCPNPACGIEMPLVRSWWLGKKKGKEAYVVPRVVDGRVEYSIGHDPVRVPNMDGTGTMSGRKGAICVACESTASVDYIREQGRMGTAKAHLIATVAEGQRSRLYLDPTPDQVNASKVERPANAPQGQIADNPRWFSPPAYGLTEFADLFTNRQLVALTTFSDLVGEARERALRDALDAGVPEGDRLENGGTGAAAYADAVATYLGLWIGRIANRNATLNVWNTVGEKVEQVFARQAIPMVWHYPEANIFSDSSGNAFGQLEYLIDAVAALPAGPETFVRQADAASRSYSGLLVSTDPPYYDNIGYSDLSDFFYVWLRRSLKPVHSDLLSTMLVPKADELVANPYRHGGKEGAKDFFEEGFEHVFERARESASRDYPIAVYYAFKQSETEATGTASTGWETILGSMLRAGWSITATWPVRSERAGRMISNGTNALASSIVLALRPRPEDAPIIDRRGFITELRSSLPDALRALQQGSVAPVDLAQAAIGPGMAVFSRYAKVIESDGSEMTVRSALARINEVLDELLTEQEGDFDPTTRFAIAWYRGTGYTAGAFGDAENLARARATALAVLERDGILSARAGKVQLFKPAELPSDYSVTADDHTSAWEALHHTIRIQETAGIPAAGAFLQEASRRDDGAVDLDLVKELAYLLFQVAEKNGWTKDAISFNGIATSWSELLDTAHNTPKAIDGTAAFDLDSLE